MNNNVALSSPQASQRQGSATKQYITSPLPSLPSSLLVSLTDALWIEIFAMLSIYDRHCHITHVHRRWLSLCMHPSSRSHLDLHLHRPLYYQTRLLLPSSMWIKTLRLHDGLSTSLSSTFHKSVDQSCFRLFLSQSNIDGDSKRMHNENTQKEQKENNDPNGLPHDLLTKNDSLTMPATSSPTLLRSESSSLSSTLAMVQRAVGYSSSLPTTNHPYSWYLSLSSVDKNDDDNKKALTTRLHEELVCRSPIGISRLREGEKDFDDIEPDDHRWILHSWKCLSLRVLSLPRLQVLQLNGCWISWFEMAVLLDIAPLLYRFDARLDYSDECRLICDTIVNRYQNGQGIINGYPGLRTCDHCNVRTSVTFRCDEESSAFTCCVKAGQQWCSSCLIKTNHHWCLLPVHFAKPFGNLFLRRAPLSKRDL
jgi:hypothetical protein